MSFVITIDGPAASGKSSVSRLLAKRMGCRWVSTGAFYRALAYVARETGVSLDQEADLVALVPGDHWSIELDSERTRVFLHGKEVTDEIYREEVGQLASQISLFAGVRAALLQTQRDCASLQQGLVAEGRDCGSVVFPNADLKVYLTASTRSRAERRAIEEGLDFAQILEDTQARDAQDSGRKSAPLIVPDGAELIDTSEMPIQEVVDHIEALAQGLGLKSL